MEHSPLPPHERQWRHPSELAAEERALLRAETLPASSRIFAVTTGTTGLLAIALLFLLVTPNRQASPVAVSASTSPEVAIADALDQAATIAAARRTSPELQEQAAVVPAALATPIGSGRYAVVLRSSLVPGNTGDVQVRLPSGRVASGSLVAAAGVDDDAALVRLDLPEPGHRVADRRPHERDVVTLMVSPPITITLADLHDMDVADGTPVVDASGHLVGLCSDRGDGVRLVAVQASVTHAVDP